MGVVVDVVDVMHVDAEAAVAAVAALRVVDTQMQAEALEPKLPELAYQKTRPVCLLQEFEPNLLLHQTSWGSRANEPCEKGELLCRQAIST